MQDALEGLCYGSGGLTEAEHAALNAGGATGYVRVGAGAAHLARLEQSNDARRLWRYFKPECAPSPYYADVQIDHARLQQLPRDRAELPGLGVIETEDKAEECDLDAVASV